MTVIYDYPYIEDAIAARLRTLTTHFPHVWQVVQGSEDILAKGAEKFAVLNWQAEDEEPLSVVDKIMTWRTTIDLYCRWKTDEVAAKATLQTLQADVYDLFKVRRSMSDINGVTATDIISEKPEYVRLQKEDAVPVFIAQKVTVKVTQYIEVP